MKISRKHKCVRCEVRQARVQKCGKIDFCAPCHREYCRQYYREHKAEYVRRNNARRIVLQDKLLGYLAEHPCVDCGEADIVVLDFDHVDGEKSFDVSRAVPLRLAWDNVLPEIKKCVIRCANCHRRKTFSNCKKYVRFRSRSSKVEQPVLSRLVASSNLAGSANSGARGVCSLAFNRGPAANFNAGGAGNSARA